MNRIAITIAFVFLILPAGIQAQRAAVGAPLSAPEAWDQEDPADSLYRAARAAMNQREYRDAARLYRDVWDDYPQSTYAPDAPYWEAFSRYRLGDLEDALEALEYQEERYSEAPTRRNGDAASLQTRIVGMLARRGSGQAAEAIAIAANAAAGIATGVSEEVARAMADVELMLPEVEEIARMAQEAAVRGVAMAGSMTGTSDIPQECREAAEPQLAALNALVHMDADRAMPVLRQVMARRDPCSVVLRRRALFIIADKESSDAVDILLTAADDDPDREVRRQAVFWLSEVDDARAVSVLESFVMDSDDAEIRERAIFALSQHDQGLPVLRRVARDATMPPHLRERAVFWLAEEGTAADIQALREMFDGLALADTTNLHLAERILFAVGQTERPEDARWLLGLAGDDGLPEELRSRAIFWAAEADVPAAELGALYTQVESRELKERVIFGLSESRDPAALDRLIEIARTETDTELRTRAIFWLGNSNDERAADAILEILAAPGGGGQ